MRGCCLFVALLLLMLAGSITATSRPVAAQLQDAPFQLLWSSSEASDTQHAAWGDVDNDGDLDLALGNWAQPSQLYRNDGGKLNSTPIWSTMLSDFTTSAAWGDVDNDGDLDLALGNFGQPNRVYRNDGGMLSHDPVWSSEQPDGTTSVVWGDYDGDSDLDLAVGNYALWDPECGCYLGGKSQLYRNDAGMLLTTPVWSTPLADEACDVAWGDVDGDGDLDLIFGGERGRMYRNDGGVFGSTPTWSTDLDSCKVALSDADSDGDLDLATAGSFTRLYRNNAGRLESTPLWSATSSSSIAWGDYDSDGDLDLAVGNFGTPSRVYRNDRGALGNTPIWSSPYSERTKSIAWSDMDGDGDLDLVFGNSGTPSRVYRNDLGILSSASSLTAPAAQPIYSTAWGDYDGDSDLDLAVGNGSLSGFVPSRVYRNDAGKISGSPSWTATLSHQTNSVAWGDVDNDEDLDLLIGNSGYPFQLYRNSGGVFSTTPAWSSPLAERTASVAWGDVDNDGDLDLAVGHVYEPSRVYRNDGGMLANTPMWSTLTIENTTSVAWGDVDNDGDLDLAVGNNYKPSRVYRNDRGRLSTTPIWVSPFVDYTLSVAWGDYDDDGDLDLAIGNSRKPSRVYRNDGGVLSPQPVWSTLLTESIMDVAWGDYDGDGDLDLALGNSNGPSRVYRNDGGVLSTTPNWSSSLVSSTESLAWSDVDNDGDLDLATGNYRGSIVLYNNMRAAHSGLAPIPSVRVFRPGRLSDAADYSTSRIWSSPTIPLTYTLFHPHDLPVRQVIGQYSLNGGGRWLPAVAATGTITTNLSTSAVVSTQQYRVTTPALIPDLATLTSTLSMTSTDTVAPNDLIADIDVEMNLTHPRDSDLMIVLTSPLGQSVRLVDRRGGASANFSGTLFDDEAATAVISGTAPFTGSYRPEQMLARFEGTPPEGLWSLAVSDLAGGEMGILQSWGMTVTLKSGAVHTFTWDVSKSGLMGQSDNVLFRLIALPDLHPTPHQPAGPYMHGANVSTTFPFRVRGSQVRVMHGTHPAADALVYRLPLGQMRGAQLYSDGAGHPFRTDPQGYLQGRGDLKIGDRLIALLPITSTGSYTLYYTNAAPTPTGLEVPAVQSSGVQTLTVSAANPLLVFNLDVALEWDARADKQFLSQLEFDLKRASELLYDWTDGQVVLGKITIYQDKQHWNDAHLRIYATNRLRPNANPGGITTQIITDPLKSELSYGPGQIRMGVVWNRYGDPQGSLGEDWPRALAHELGHYALYLDDNYIGLDAHGLLVPVDTCTGTAMSDPYRDDYSEFHPVVGWLPGCARTLSHQHTGRADWATITTFYPQLHMPPDDPSKRNAGPSVLPLDTARITFAPIPPATTALAPIFSLAKPDGSRYLATSSARVFLFSSGDDRVIDLGRPTRDQVLARGARSGDRLCVYDGAVGQLGCEEAIQPTDQQLVVASVPQWRPEVLLTPVTSTTLVISVTNVSNGLPLKARLFPAGGVSTPIHALDPVINGGYSGQFKLTSPAFEGVIQLWVDDTSTPRREVVVSYAMGGNPGRVWARGAPRGNPGRVWARGAPLISSDGQVILFGEDLAFDEGQFFVLQSMTSIPATPSWATLVGSPYHLAANIPITRNLSISFGYLGSEVSAYEEAGLRVYYWDTARRRWEALPTVVNAEENIASARIRGAGLYALMSSIELPLSSRGWNLVGYPAPGTQRMPDALASIQGYYTTVYGYDSTDRADPWKVYDVRVPPKWAPIINDLTALTYRRGYWIYATEPITALLKGPTPMLLASDGSQWLPPPPATFYGVVPDSMPAAGLTVQAWMNGTLCSQTQAETIDGQAQAVFVLDVPVAGADNQDACGLQGRVVTFVFKDGGRVLLTVQSTWEPHGPQDLNISTIYLPLFQR